MYSDFTFESHRLKKINIIKKSEDLIQCLYDLRMEHNFIVYSF